MINKSSLKRIGQLAGAFLLAGTMVGCGDDDSPAVDAATPDGPDMPDGGPTPDACIGHGCGGTDTPFSLDEGGEFRLEQFQYAPDGTGPGDDLAAHAFFFSGQTPGYRDLDGTVIEIRQELEDQGYVCQDFVAGNNFDNGKSQAAQTVVDSREYYDVGASASLTNTGDDSVIELPKAELADGADAVTDLSASLVHDFLYKGDKDTAVSFKTAYKPAIIGSGDYPVLDLKYGQSAVGDEMADPDTGNGDALLYVPSDFEMTSPAEADFYEPGALVFTKGQDLTLTYDINDPEDIVAPATPPVDGQFPTIIPFIGFVDDNGQVDAYCLKVTPNERDDGEFIVPSEVLEIIPTNPTTGYVLFGRFTHVAWEVQRTPITRLDLLGVACKIAPQWVVNEAAQ